LKNTVDILFVAKRRNVLEILYYCPNCGSVNELPTSRRLTDIECRDCRQLNDCSVAAIQLTTIRIACDE
jgi:hypothetical protein